MPKFNPGKAPKIPGDICYHFARAEVPKLLASLGMSRNRKRFRAPFREPRPPASLGMPRHQKRFRINGKNQPELDSLQRQQLIRAHWTGHAKLTKPVGKKYAVLCKCAKWASREL